MLVRNLKVHVTGGPFTETKEILAGFYLVDASDLNEAIETASKIPPGRGVVVRSLASAAG